MASIYPTSKEFVNKKLKFPVSDIKSNFHNLTKNFGGRRPAHEALRMFIQENFEDETDLENWLPPDWNSSPKGLDKISDEKLKTWATELNIFWKTLGRRVSEDVKLSPDMYSIIPIPHSFILSNAKSNELHYWDAYWILKGLLICNMTISAKDVLRNLFFLVQEFGYIPRGNRIYYEGRSNPPMLGCMMDLYLQHTTDFEFIRENIQVLETEINYWMINRTRTVKKDGIEYQMFHYHVNVQAPRPEAYRDDVESGTLANTEKELLDHFVSIQSASESGWDFSTRWFVVHGFNHGNRSNTATQHLIPVDLNSIMHRNYTFLKWWYNRIGNKEKVRHYTVMANELLTAIENVLWNDEVGIWQDYDVRFHKLRNYFYLSNFTPLWTKSYSIHPEILTVKVLEYLNTCKMDNYAVWFLAKPFTPNVKVIYYNSAVDLTHFRVNHLFTGGTDIWWKERVHSETGGMPTSKEFSGEEWDFPNAWPALQYCFIKGLDKIGTPVASELAFHFAEKFIQANFKAYNEHGTIFPTYDCLIPGRYGIGHGIREASSLTLGVIFDFFIRWGSEFRSPDKDGLRVGLFPVLSTYQYSHTRHIIGTPILLSILSFLLVYKF